MKEEKEEITDFVPFEEIESSDERKFRPELCDVLLLICNALAVIISLTAIVISSMK